MCHGVIEKNLPSFYVVSRLNFHVFEANVEQHGRSGEILVKVEGSSDMPSFSSSNGGSRGGSIGGGGGRIGGGNSGLGRSGVSIGSPKTGGISTARPGGYIARSSGNRTPTMSPSESDHLPYLLLWAALLSNHADKNEQELDWDTIDNPSRILLDEVPKEEGQEAQPFDPSAEATHVKQILNDNPTDPAKPLAKNSAS